MKIEEIDDIFKTLKRRFDKDPKEWKVLGDIDARGNKDLFISQREDLWHIKTKPVSPFTGIAKGVHVRNLDDEIQAELVKNGLAGEKLLFSMIVPQDKNAIFASGIESFARHKSKNLKKMVSEKNRDVDRQLMDAVEKTFERKFPRRKDMFV
ncbi:MAG: hypothetical protein ACTSVI_17095 [Promethearchaeota archaeon]